MEHYTTVTCITNIALIKCLFQNQKCVTHPYSPRMPTFLSSYMTMTHTLMIPCSNTNNFNPSSPPIIPGVQRSRFGMKPTSITPYSKMYISTLPYCPTILVLLSHGLWMTHTLINFVPFHYTPLPPRDFCLTILGCRILITPCVQSFNLSLHPH